ncbi:MAG: TatD family hydrolase [Micromonosporaceae bacterium]|nr:TatD family hydrolase [Micromonosporaceae bacterium]
MARSRVVRFPPDPEPLPLPVVDSHTHLDLTLRDRGVDGPATVEESLQRAASVGVDRIVQIGTDVPSSRWAATVAAEHSAVLAAVAVHPNEAPRLDDLDEALRQIEKLAAHERVRAVGETGLDHFRTAADGHEAQERSFRAHIEIAKRCGKALVIHDRDAHDECLKVLDSAIAPGIVVMHCFSGDEAFAMDCIRRGYVLSFAGNITFASAGALRDAVRVTPTEQIMVETDAPFLTPVPHRGKPNASYCIPVTVRAMAEIKGLPVEDLCERLSETSERVFGGWAVAG